MSKQIILKLFKENDYEHSITLSKTGFWGKIGAGCLFICSTTQRVLVPLRSQEVLQPGTWGVWGGAVDSDITPEESVRKEAYEEAGYKKDFKLIPVYVYQAPKGDFKYYNYFAIIEEEFDPQLNWETEDYKWCTFEELLNLRNKHFGLEALLNDRESLQILRHYLN